MAAGALKPVSLSRTKPAGASRGVNHLGQTGGRAMY